MSKIALLTAALALLTLPATAQDAGATAVMLDQSATNLGTLTLMEMDGGVHVSGELAGVPNGEHGFHVHETGDCSAPDGTSAGGHFNPATTAHGRVGQGEHHAGDSDNIVANDQGTAMVDTLLRGATLDQGETGIIGRGVIVHADPDDYATQPTGNAGARLACGVIVGT